MDNGNYWLTGIEVKVRWLGCSNGDLGTYLTRGIAHHMNNSGHLKAGPTCLVGSVVEMV